MTEARLDVVIGSSGTVSGGSAVNRVIDQVKHNFLDLSAKIFVAQRALEQVWRTAKSGAEFEESMGRLNRQMGMFNSTAQLMVNGLHAVTNGQISVEKSAMMASRALAAGLNPDQVKTFAQAADLLGDVLGTDIPTAFGQIVEAAASGRGQILANIGVYVDLEDEVRKLAVSTGRTTEQITRQERAMLAAKSIVEQTGDAMHRMSDGQLSDADRINALEARWDDLWKTIAIGSKNAIFALIDYNSKLQGLVRQITPSKETLKSFVPDIFLPLSERKGFAQDEKVLQGVLGRAIVQDTLGNLNRPSTARREPIPQLPASLRGRQLDAERDRLSGGLQSDVDRQRAAFESTSRLLEIDQQRQLISREQFVALKGQLQLREIDVQREGIEKMMANEQAFHRRRVKIGFDTTQEKIEEEERYRTKVAEIHEKLRDQEQAKQAALLQLDAEGGLARAQAEEARGQRIQQQLIADYQSQEARRQEDLNATELYYRGQMDLANAKFATDKDIAAKERELLSSQLAFRLRLSQDEATRLLLMRQVGNEQGFRDILGRADPTLSPRAKEGIANSFAARDIELMERANGNFFAGWSRGMQRYVRDTTTGFGMAQDMARRTAQTMEQGFQQFFFAPLENGWQGVLDSMLDMTKRILSQIAAQMATSSILQLVGTAGGAIGGLFGGPNAGVLAAQNRGAANPALFGPGFASGGMGDFGSGTVTTLHGREAIVPLPDGRSIPVSLTLPGSASPPQAVTMPVTIINQHQGTDVEARQTTGSSGGPELEILVTRSVNRSIGEGRMDKVLRSRFNLSPGGG